MEAGSDSDAPEEITAEEGIKQDEEIQKVRRENIRRVAREGKERRRQWAQRKAQPKSSKEHTAEIKEMEQQQEAPYIPGMLPSNIVEALAAREKQTFSSDSEEEIINHKPTTRKKKQKSSGPETVILKDIPPAQCLENSMGFLKRRKMQVSRSTSILKNANQALRLLSSQGSLFSKS
ncbi:uncharacterized protein [Elaeis guineensis]|uniref:Uncharacterized protein LOC105033451 isoform X2 n=1 Tax=Elaeis guineensis var. tenera TaxID=51953 RepID=A0A6I9QCS6_ELAGV|nr:uncharacterized protein LOC105033451 isoform X2 [Elaeis guineensis]